MTNLKSDHNGGNPFEKQRNGKNINSTSVF